MFEEGTRYRILGMELSCDTFLHLDPNTLPNEEPARKIKIIQKHVKKSKLLLNRY
jgi:hypothetical protein